MPPHAYCNVIRIGHVNTYKGKQDRLVCGKNYMSTTEHTALKIAHIVVSCVQKYTHEHTKCIVLKSRESQRRLSCLSSSFVCHKKVPVSPPINKYVLF